MSSLRLHINVLNKLCFSIVGIFVLCSSQAYGQSNAPQDLLLLDGSGLTRNQMATGNAINIICPQGVAGADLQARCNALIGDRQQQGGDFTDSQLGNILGQTTSEQTAAQGTNAIELSSIQSNNVGGRIMAIRQGGQGGLQLSGLSLRDQQGNLLAKNELDQLAQQIMPLSAGDGNSVFDRLGIFINGSYEFGDRNTTSNEIGFGSDSYGTTLGADYRFTDNFTLGVAFGYGHTDTQYANSLGSMDSDSYSGSLYGTFYTDNGFYIDGIITGTSIDYESRRNISYSIATETINTSAKGKNEGEEYNASLSSGYNFNLGGLTLTPQVRVEYSNTDIDALNETGGQGWALRIDRQNIDSLTTALGGQASYAISFPWGVILPTVRAEWVHEFLNEGRSIDASYVQDSSNTQFNIFTDSADNDFAYVGAGVSAQFTHGVSAFFSYETLLAHRYASSHAFTGGVRYELAF